jgi:hypothetical protein
MSFWSEQREYFQGEHRVPGRESRMMRLWVFEAGFWVSMILMMTLLGMGPGADTRGVEALPWFFASFFGLWVAYFTGGFGIAYAFDKLFPKKK